VFDGFSGKTVGIWVVGCWAFLERRGRSVWMLFHRWWPLAESEAAGVEGPARPFFGCLVAVFVVVASFTTAGIFPFGHVFAILLHFQLVRLVVAFTLRVGSQVPRSA
jgi:Flp pilus assembly protein TadB